MKTSLLSLLFTSLLANGVIVFAEDTASTIDTSAWKCEYCELEQGMSTYLEGGLGFVSQDSFKFGEYSGLHEKGAFLVGNIESRFRNPENASYWNINATDIGLDTRSLEVQGGRQGLYELSLLYNELSHHISDSARTPFLGEGENQLTLPAGWVTGGNTSAMTALAGSLTDVSLETNRKQFGVGAIYLPFRKWETSVNYRHEVKEGKRKIAGSFYFNSAELVQPVDYTTDTIDAAAAYNGKTWQARLAYQTSIFKNANESLIWENPYTPIVAGADQGELALAPDNQFHQLLASLAISIGDASQAMIDVASGRMTQNQDYLNSTRNPNLVVAPLPAASLDGRVDTKNANVKWITRFGERFKFNASYQYSDRDNKTPQYNYEWVTTDSNVATPRTNLPYSYTRNTYKLSAEHKPTATTKVSVGYNNQQYERTFQEVEKSEEVTVWASFVDRGIDNADFRIKGTRQRRDIDSYQVVPEIDGPENPLLRKYNMADRDRDTFGVRVDVAATNDIALGLSLDLAQDDYPDSTLGLTNSQESSIGLDLSMLLTKATTVNFFVNHENISSTVKGSQLYNLPDWSGRISDSFEIVGMGFNHELIEDKLNVGADYVYTESTGRIRITDGGVGSQLPTLVTKLNSLKIYGNYQLSETLLINGTYWYEHYDSRDWALDDVSEGTVSNNLSLGQESPAYDVNVFTVSLRYKF